MLVHLDFGRVRVDNESMRKESFLHLGLTFCSTFTRSVVNHYDATKYKWHRIATYFEESTWYDGKSGNSDDRSRRGMMSCFKLTFHDYIWNYIVIA